MIVAADTPLSRHPRFPVLLTASLVSSLIILDSNVVAVSIPAIARSTHASFTDVQWVVGAYVLAYASLLLTAGSIADLYGRKRAMLLGLAAFALASALCGASTSAPQLDAARALQGVGGAFLLTASMAVISHDFAGPDRGRALAFWGASVGGALAAGPIIGGGITGTVGWRWAFLVNLPIGAILSWATWRFATESRDPGARRVDLAGMATFSLGLAAAVWTLIAGDESGWASHSTVLRAVAAATLLAGFVAIEARRPGGMIDLGLFSHRPFLGAVAAMVGYGASSQVMIFFIPQLLQDAHGLSPTAAGLGMVPFALPMVLAPRLTARYGAGRSARSLLATGLGACCLGDASMAAAAAAHLPYPALALAMFAAGCGAGLLNGETVRTISALVPVERAGMASGIASTTRYVGILVAVAALGVVLSGGVRRGLSVEPAALRLDALASDRVAAGGLEELLRAVPASDRPGVAAAAARAYAHGFAEVAGVAAIVAALSCALTFALLGAGAGGSRGALGTRSGPCAFVDCRDPV